MDTVSRILLWAAGSPEDLNTVEAFDEDDLLSLVGGHALLARLHRRLHVERPQWATRALSLRAWTLARYARQTTEAHIAALREIIAAAYPAGDTAAISIKGLSLYALTGDEDNLRASGDIDLYAADLEHLWAVMTGLGYASEEKYDDGSHFAILSRRGVQVELHRAFPVWAYPPDLADVDLYPAHNPGLWRQPFADILETDLRYQDIADNAVGGVAPGTEGLQVPDVTLSAFLLCSHTFRHYVEGHTLPTPIVRLGELADIRGLVRHPRFESGKFRALADRFDGHAAAAFARHVIALFLEDDLAGFDELPRLNGFPMQLTRWSGWAVLHTPEELLRPLDPKAAFERLQPNVVTLGQEMVPERVVVQGREALPVCVSADVDGERITLYATVLAGLPPGHRYQVMLYYPYRYRGTRPAGFEIPYKYSNTRWAQVGYGDRGHSAPWTDGGDLSIQVGQHECSIHLTERGCTACLPFAWSALPPAFRASCTVPMVLLIMRLREDQPLGVRLSGDHLTLVPLHINA